MIHENMMRITCIQTIAQLWEKIGEDLEFLFEALWWDPITTDCGMS
jgi:hypothetical protein